MLNNIIQFFKKLKKSEKEESKSTAKERLHLVLAQDRANISADFLEMMKQEILEVIKKYIDIDEKAIDVRLTNKEGEDGSVGAPALYANIPIITIKNDARKLVGTLKTETKKEEKNKDKETQSTEKDESESKTEKKTEEKEKVEKNNKAEDESCADGNNIEKDANNSTSSNEEKSDKEEDITKETENAKLDEDDNEKKNS